MIKLRTKIGWVPYERKLKDKIWKSLCKGFYLDIILKNASTLKIEQTHLDIPNRNRLKN